MAIIIFIKASKTHLSKMKLVLLFLVLITSVNCSKKHLTLDDYARERVNFAKQKISYPNNDFIVYIPKDWDWKIERYDHDNILLGIDAGSQPDKDGFIDLISIQKLMSFGEVKDLKSEFYFLLNLTKEQSNELKIIETGETKIFKQKAYFIHAKSDSGSYGELEMMTFILESEKEGVFYHLNASASQTKDLKTNMAVIIQSLKTFETKNI